MRVGRIILSPAFIIFMAFSLGGIIAYYAAANFNNFPVLRSLLFMNGVPYNTEYFTVRAFFWIASSLGLFMLMTVLAQKYTPSLPRDFRPTRSVKLLLLMHGLFFVVTVMWILLTIAQFGSLNALMNMVSTDADAAREAFLQNKIFYGMRLFYAGFVVTGATAATLLGYHNRKPSLTHRERMICLFVLGSSLVLLTLLPTVMSQRLLLVNLMVASFVGYSLAQGRITGIKYILLGAITVAAVWTLREYFAFRHVFPSASIGELSGQKAMYYVLNDYFNILNPIVQVDPGYTKGAFMLQGPSFYVMMTDLWEDYMVYERTIVDSLIGGGELPFFTQQYVDLGLFAFPFIAILGFVIGVLYRRAQSDIRYVIFYAILSPGLVLSVHSFQYVHQNTIFHLVIAFIFATLLSRSTVR